MTDAAPSLDRDVARRILRAAIHLFARKGFAATTTREIVEAAGITKPMLYYYYGSKEGVCRAAVTMYIQEVRQDLERVLRESPDARALLVEFVWMAFRFHKANPEFYRMAMAMFYGPEGEVPGVDLAGMASEVGAYFRRVAHQACAQGIARPGCEDALARMLDGAIFAWTRSVLCGAPVELTRELAEQTVQILLHGFAPEGTRATDGGCSVG